MRSQQSFALQREPERSHADFGGGWEYCSSWWLYILSDPKLTVDHLFAQSVKKSFREAFSWRCAIDCSCLSILLFRGKEKITERLNLGKSQYKWFVLNTRLFQNKCLLINILYYDDDGLLKSWMEQRTLCLLLYLVCQAIKSVIFQVLCFFKKH